MVIPLLGVKTRCADKSTAEHYEQHTYIHTLAKSAQFWCWQKYKETKCSKRPVFRLDLLIMTYVVRPTLKNSLFAVTRLTHQNCPYPKNFIDILKEDFFFLFEYLKFQSLNYLFFDYNNSLNAILCSLTV